MNRTAQEYLVSYSAAERGMKLHMSALAGNGRVTRNLNRRVVRKFVDDLSETLPSGEKEMTLSPKGIANWMINDMKGRTRRYVLQRFGVIRRYLGTLQQAGSLKVQDLSELGPCGGGVSLEPLVSALQSCTPHEALAALATPPPPPGPLTGHIASYLKLHHSLGKQYRGNRYDLLHFDRFLQGRRVTEVQAIDSAMIQEWIDLMTCSTIVRGRKVRLLGRFFDHLVVLGIVESNPISKPLIDSFRKQSSAIAPFIFTQDQIRSILNKARKLPRSGFFPLRPEACHTMLALLYGLGLRCGEVQRLQLRDLDLQQQVLFIRETKFHKNRYVPFGPKMANCLETYLSIRRKHLTPIHAADPLFVTLWRSSIHDNTIREPFTEILLSIGVTGGNSRRMPRLHDLRHSFAVHRLARWYREGVDVQSRLTLLATFLGHTEVKHTQVYLNATEELLQQANDRFFKFNGSLFDEETIL